MKTGTPVDQNDKKFNPSSISISLPGGFGDMAGFVGGAMLNMNPLSGE